MGFLDRIRGRKKEPDSKPGRDAPDKSRSKGDPLAKEVRQMSFQEGQQALKPRWQPGTRYRDERVDPLHSKEGAASGNINQVDLLAYEGIKLGSGSRGFFKEAKAGEDVGDAATAIGIDEKDPRLDARSVATSRAAEMAGLGNVVAKTTFATHGGKAGTVSEAAPGRAMTDTRDLEVTDPAIKAQLEKDPEMNFGNEKGLDYFGSPARYRKDPDTGKIYRKKGTIELHHHDLTNPRTQKELNDLQWVDAITGQVDRHGGNIFIDPSTGAVKGIDNDAAFGSISSSNPADLSSKKLGASHFVGMPTLIDASTAKNLETMDEEAFRKRLEPLLSQPEVEAALSRLKAVKQRIQFLRLAGSVVGESPDQQYQAWDEKTYQEQTQESDASYLGRAVQNRQEAQASLDKHGPRADLVVETPEKASTWKPKEMPVQVPRGLEKAVSDMPSLLDPTFDRHRSGKTGKKKAEPDVKAGTHRIPKATETVKPPETATESKPPSRPPPQPPKVKADKKPGEAVPTLKKPSEGGTKPTTPKPPPGVQVSKPPDRPPLPRPTARTQSPDTAVESKPPSRPPPQRPGAVRSRAQAFEAMSTRPQASTSQDQKRKT